MMNIQIVSQKTKRNSKIFCNWCGQPTELIWVHGHGQCRWCGVNIDECCRGENCKDSKEKPSKLNWLSQKKFSNRIETWLFLTAFIYGRNSGIITGTLIAISTRINFFYAMELIPLITNYLIYFLGALLLVLIISYIYRMIKSQSSIEEEKIRAHREVMRKYIQTQSQYLTNSHNYKTTELNRVKYTAPQSSHSEHRSRSNSTATMTRSTSQKNLTGSGSHRYSILNSTKTESAELYFPSIHYSQSDRKNHYYR